MSVLLEVLANTFEETGLMKHISRLSVCAMHTRTSESIYALSLLMKLCQIYNKGHYRNAFLAYLHSLVSGCKDTKICYMQDIGSKM